MDCLLKKNGLIIKASWTYYWLITAEKTDSLLTQHGLFITAAWNAHAQ